MRKYVNPLVSIIFSSIIIFCLSYGIIKNTKTDAQPIKSELVVTSQIRVVSPNGKNQIVLRATDHNSYISINEKENRNVIILGGRDQGVMFMQADDRMSFMDGDDIEKILEHVYEEKK